MAVTGITRAQSDLSVLWRFPLLLLGMLALVIAVLSGLARMGWSMPQPVAEALPWHGVLMIPVFFATVIGLERAVALASRWAYLAPLCSALAWPLLMAGWSGAAMTLMLAASLIFSAASWKVWRLQPQLHGAILLLGALSLVVGNALLLLGFTIHQVLPAWLAYLVLTIAGERLELSRLVVRDEALRRQLARFSLLPLLAIPVGLLWPQPALALLAVGLLLIGYWLLRNDIARRTVRQQGLTRFTAVCMLLGYLWLLLSALLFAALAAGWIGSWDAPLHSLLLGFVFAMVFGHALLIFPAVTRLKIPYHPLFYLPLLLLQISLVVRLVHGGLGHFGGYALGGLLNAVALGLFILLLIASILRGRLAAQPPSRGG